MSRRAWSHSRLIGRLNLSRTAAVESAAPLRLALDIFLVFTPKSAGNLSPGAEALNLQPFKTERPQKNQAKRGKKKNQFLKMSFLAPRQFLSAFVGSELCNHCTESEGTLFFSLYIVLINMLDPVISPASLQHRPMVSTITRQHFQRWQNLSGMYTLHIGDLM